MSAGARERLESLRGGMGELRLTGTEERPDVFAVLMRVHEPAKPRLDDRIVDWVVEQETGTGEGASDALRSVQVRDEIDPAGHCEQREQQLDERWRKVVEGVATRQDQTLDPIGMAGGEDLCERAAGVTPDDGGLIHVERIEETDQGVGDCLGMQQVPPSHPSAV